VCVAELPVAPRTPTPNRVGREQGASEVAPCGDLDDLAPDVDVARRCGCFVIADVICVSIADLAMRPGAPAPHFPGREQGAGVECPGRKLNDLSPYIDITNGSRRFVVTNVVVVETVT